MANHIVIESKSGYDTNNCRWSDEVTAHLIDDGTLDTVIEIDLTKTRWIGKMDSDGVVRGKFKTTCRKLGKERFSQEYAAQWRDPDTGELSAKGIWVMSVGIVDALRERVEEKKRAHRKN